MKKLKSQHLVTAIEEVLTPKAAEKLLKPLRKSLEVAARSFAKEIGVVSLGLSDTSDGIICTFEPVKSGDPCPAILDRFDHGGYWSKNPVKTILLVDDDTTIQILGSAALERVGAKVLVAGSAEEAWECCKSNHVDGVITDIVLPGQDGNWLAEKITFRDRAKGKMRIPVITISGQTAQEVAELSIESSGGTLHIQKPIDWMKLGTLISVLCNTSGTVKADVSDS